MVKCDGYGGILVGSCCFLPVVSPRNGEPSNHPTSFDD